MPTVRLSRPRINTLDWRCEPNPADRAYTDRSSNEPRGNCLAGAVPPLWVDGAIKDGTLAVVDGACPGLAPPTGRSRPVSTRPPGTTAAEFTPRVAGDNMPAICHTRVNTS